MTNRIRALIVVLLILSGVWFVWKGNGAAQQALSQDGQELIVQADQLPAPWTDLLPLRCEGALATRYEIKTLSCVLTNNTSNNIEAGALTVSVVLDINGSPSPLPGTLSFDTFLHPDFRAQHPSNSIKPGTDYRLEDGPSTFDRPILKVIASIDYVEFSDRSKAGPDVNGSAIINAQREGARKYKDWLDAKYRTTRSIEVIGRLLAQEGDVSVEAGISDMNQEQGARIFRRQQRRLYETKGAEALRKHFPRLHE